MRLAAYEDTGLTPEEVNDAVVGAKLMAKSKLVSAFGVAAESLRELAEADKAGRLVVLPCKIGEKLWVIGRDNVPREMALEAPDIRAICTGDSDAKAD